ncbi:MAG: tRNA (uridine(34)/cytosine(34)/5-carboxymethylaminomethyluridine(34)-2'-O)-methyltransferase TrmL [Thiotrichaceae bacterium]|nr:tRNA (uridine(34)/cytosine(34)/5-carboxymethylaminomethyluridine(34)-2'-O)-methyltransferase TrmL [Thiotrichaceae bacterium]
MFHIALFEPEIPPNTGNIMRLCVNTHSHLHLIHPISFSLDEKRLRRAGMDYRDIAVINEHKNYDAFIEHLDSEQRIFALTTKGSCHHTQAEYRKGDVFLFGPESRGLPDNVLESLADKQKVRLPIAPNSRSLNLSNTVAIMVYEALRQQQFPNLS